MLGSARLASRWRRWRLLPWPWPLGVLVREVVLGVAAGAASASAASTLRRPPSAARLRPPRPAPSSPARRRRVPAGVADALRRGAVRRPDRRRAGCATRDLQAKAGLAQGAAGSIYQVIDFTNISNAPCTLYGYPGVSLAAGTPVTQVGAAASRSPAAAAALVTLAPGQTANALLRIVAGGELPDGDVLADRDHVPADLPAEPDDADLPGLQVDRVRVDLGQPADDRRGAGGRRERRTVRRPGFLAVLAAAVARRPPPRRPGVRASTRALDQSR